MPRATTNPSPRRRSPKSGKKAPSPPLRYRCPEAGCLWSYDRDNDLFRHSLTHMTPEEREKYMYVCEHPGCTHKTLQLSNMKTHIRTHTGAKPHNCPDCTYSTGDPASLTFHRKRVHAYRPRDHTTRPRRVHTPYNRGASASSSSSSSASSPSSAYFVFSLESWPSSASSESESLPSSPDDSVGYDMPYLAGSQEMDYSHQSSPGLPASWTDAAALHAVCASQLDAVCSKLDAACASHLNAAYASELDAACAFQLDAYNFVLPTARPGPAALCPAATLAQFQLDPEASTFYEQLSALLADLDFPASPDLDFSASAAVDMAFNDATYTPQELTAPALEFSAPSPEFSLELADPAVYHAHAGLNAEWLRVAPPL
ncbi:hypothetical protein C8R44DRAFT_889528 [Mycena epipterygia]|nr:hypothetical protein C8R44DRAFT_889528 [Mycena epipterygia]